jgi:hypothetical protein
MKEAKDVLTCSNPGGCIANVVVEINGPQFSGYPVSVPATLAFSSARSAAGLLILFTGRPGGATRAGEQKTRVHFGDSSTISP